MKVLIIGYGKMGHEIEAELKYKKHEIIGIIDKQTDWDNLNNKPEVAIEFSNPKVAYSNIENCFKRDIPIVSGTTGCEQDIQKLIKICKKENKTFIHSNNFSIGMNVFFSINKKLAELMSRFDDYNVALTEKHHISKVDAPSGTAISLAKQIMQQNVNKKEIVNYYTENKNKLGIISIREGEAKGYHSVTYKNDIDEIKITHNAFSRKGFAQGAVIVAEWIKDKKGFFTIDNIFNF